MLRKHHRTPAITFLQRRPCGERVNFLWTVNCASAFWAIPIWSDLAWICISTGALVDRVGFMWQPRLFLRVRNHQHGIHHTQSQWNMARNNRAGPSGFFHHFAFRICLLSGITPHVEVDSWSGKPCSMAMEKHQYFICSRLCQRNLGTALVRFALYFDFPMVSGRFFPLGVFVGTRSCFGVFPIEKVSCVFTTR